MLWELVSEQPATYSPEAAERAVRALVDVRSADHPVRRMAVPHDFIFFSRLSLSLNMVLTDLGATFDVRSTVDDMDGVAEPVTALGKAHVAWVRTRGLPFGTEPHDRLA
jgi:hypothetical protein